MWQEFINHRSHKTAHQLLLIVLVPPFPVVRCTPLGIYGRKGRPVVRIIMAPVRWGPEPGLLSLRREWLDAKEGGVGEEREGERKRGRMGGVKRRLRVVCYNILADM